MTTGLGGTGSTPLDRADERVSHASDIGGTLRAVGHDAGLAVVGLGDLAVRAVYDFPERTTLVGRRALQILRDVPSSFSARFAHLIERGHEVVAQWRHDPAVRVAGRRTATAERKARRAARSVRRAAMAHAASIQHSAAAFGRRARTRYRHMTVDELRALAARRGVDGRSRMNKKDLISHLAH